MNPRRLIACFTFVMLGAGSFTAVAAAPDALDSMRACKSLTDVAKRAGCYEAELAKLDSQPAAPAPAAAARASTPPPPAAAKVQAPASVAAEKAPVAAAAAFGEEAVRKGPDPSQPNSITAKIEKLGRSPRDLAIITLDNGQVWRQLEATDYFPMSSGDTVLIKKGALGSYKLIVVKEGWTRGIPVSRSK